MLPRLTLAVCALRAATAGPLDSAVGVADGWTRVDEERPTATGIDRVTAALRLPCVDFVVPVEVSTKKPRLTDAEGALLGGAGGASVSSSPAGTEPPRTSAELASAPGLPLPPFRKAADSRPKSHTPRHPSLASMCPSVSLSVGANGAGPVAGRFSASDGGKASSPSLLASPTDSAAPPAVPSPSLLSSAATLWSRLRSALRSEAARSKARAWAWTCARTVEVTA